MTELVFILDRSGSMSGLEKDTIGGFNSMLEKQRKEPGEAMVSTVLFDNEIEVVHDRIGIKEVPKLTEEEYFVRGCTALLDAVGERFVTSAMFTSMLAVRMSQRRPYLSSLLMDLRMPAAITLMIKLEA